MFIKIPPASFLPFAHQLADAAGEIIRPYFGAHGAVEAKDDQSPVTKADRDAEAAMRALIEQHYPDHAIYGEEFGRQENAAFSVVPPPLGGRLGGGRNNTPAEQLTAPPQPSPYGGGSSSALSPHYTWVLDPIDGTRAFIAGRKEWGTLIALCADGVPILGILDQPVTGERWVGARGQVTHYSVVPVQATDPRQRGKEIPVKTRPCDTLSDAEFSTTSAAYFTPVQAKQIVALAQACARTVRDGDCYAYGLLARGLRDVVVDAGLKPYDILALVPMIEGAGGKITGWDGAPITLTHFDTAIACNDSLYAAALKMLSN